jgi:hypothetical protein
VKNNKVVVVVVVVVVVWCVDFGGAGDDGTIRRGETQIAHRYLCTELVLDLGS